MRTRVHSRSPEETFGAGESLARHLAAGDVVLLSGPLGAGKSVFARGVARAFGAMTWRGSPTYNLVHEYPTVPPLYHADLYRLAPAGIDDIGLEEYARPDAVLMVEWADRDPALIASMATNRALRVSIVPQGESERIVVIDDCEAA